MSRSVVNWFKWLDSDAASSDSRCDKVGRPETEFDRWLPFVFLHAGCLLVLATGVSQTAIVVCIALYCVRMFAITGFYHRYFSHRAFKTSRFVQFLFALIGCSSVQRGPLWWAAHHRQHHAASDTDDDIHSPVSRSFVWSHMGWITSSKNMPTDYARVKDFAKYPELMLLNRFDWFMPALLFVSLFAAGEYLWVTHPELNTTGCQLVAWGFFVSTTLLFHATCAINSVSHLIGYQRYETNDNSRNNPLLALVTLGEGWHNNHHKFSYAARQGIIWWELDITYYVLFLFSCLGIISDLKPVPAHAESPAHAARRKTVVQSIEGRQSNHYPLEQQCATTVDQDLSR